MNLNGKKILVTGGTRGIGAAVVAQLRDKGCAVLVVARDAAALDRMTGVDALAVDLSQPRAAEKIADWVSRNHPDLDGIINNAAIMDHTFLTRNGAEKLGRVETEIAINLTAPVQLTTLLLPILARRPEAVVVNVTSGLALVPIPNAAVYSATKAGIRIFTKALRLQVKAEGWNIGLSEVLMTRVDTSLSEGEPSTKYPPAKAAADLIQGVEAGRKEIYIEKVKLLRLVWRLSPALAERMLSGHTGATD